MSKIEEMAIQFANEMYGEYNTSNIVENGWPKAKSFYEQGANYVLEQIENFMKDLDLGNSAEEKFYKLDILADIHRFIQKLKEK